MSKEFRESLKKKKKEKQRVSTKMRLYSQDAGENPGYKYR